MRIGLFTETYTPYISGLVTSTVVLKTALEKQGHEVYVITANLENFQYEYDEKEKILKIPGIPIGIYDARLTSIYPISAVNKIKSWRLDVIHSHTEFAIGTFARIFARHYNIPVVHTYHTMYEDYVHYVTKGHFDKSSKKLLEYMTKFYCDKTVTELIVPTPKAYELFKNKYNVDRNIHIIPTGIEVDRFFKENVKKSQILKLKRDLSIDNKDIVILFVGRIAKEKNIIFLIEAQKKLVELNKNIKLLLVGDGPEKEEYEKLVKKLKIENNVIFTGKVKQEEMPIYYHISNYFTSASLSETQGLTILEAMASEIIPICIEDDSFKTVITNRLNGILFSNEKEYIENIRDLINSNHEKKYISKQARIQAENYNSNNYALRVSQVYERSVKERKDKNKFGIISKIIRKIKGE